MNAPALRADEFSEFFRAVHYVDAFPWQARLAKVVCGQGWPAALDVPTGAGKTAAIDVAVFHLALEADRRSARTAPVRILFVVDRRLVVDEAYERAKKLAAALASPESDIVRRVADRLRHLCERPERPLVVARLRGGAPKDPDWVRTPAQPVVVVSTVDQVGSRMFFRGYGVSDSMKPVHAGLIGSDALLLLDEAHLSQPFVKSVQDARTFQRERPWSEDACPAPFAIVTLSATQTEQAQDLLRSEDRTHPVLGPRLARGKPAELLLVKAPAKDDAFTAEFAERAWGFSRLGGGPAQVVGIVVNRVQRARAVFDSLTKRLVAQAEPAGDAALLMGRSRPIDRDESLRNLLPRMAAQRSESKTAKPLFVVATQCIEAGADLDFDALVTEVAPLDSLRQRFGRLNRMGRAIETRACIVAALDQIQGKDEPDAVYGTALSATWGLLNEKAGKEGRGKSATLVIDFGVEAAGRWLPEGNDLVVCITPRASAPVMLPAFVEQWMCTSPVPDADPEVALFLHGPTSGPGDVQIVWRADLDQGSKPDEWIERVAVCPPSTLEAIAVPIGEAKRWLRGKARSDITDVEAGTDEEGEDEDVLGCRALRWRGAEHDETGAVTGESLRPGDLIVVPAVWGGCDEWGWAPTSSAPVRDRARDANRAHRGRDILRLSPRLFEATLIECDRVEPARAAARAQRFEAALDALADASTAEVLAALRTSPGNPAEWNEWHSTDGPPRVIRGGSGTPLALERRAQPSEAVGASVTEDDQSSAGLRAVALPEHSRGVRDFAARFAAQAGLPEPIAQDVALAAFLHDAGKAHPAFKLWMYGGDELAAAGGETLAKSGRAVLGRAARARARLPSGARHEVASLAFAEAHPAFARAHDADLVLWLIGTHHGWGRPFFPPVPWPEQGTVFEVSLGDGTVRSRDMKSFPEFTAAWLDRQARLSCRYGPWGLARLEAILRLADHRRSETEQEEAP
jgi:CRISPR-associated endonuclease/helicase Cas3